MHPISEIEVRGLFAIAGIPALRIYQLAHSYFSYQEGEDLDTTMKNALYRAQRPSWLVKTPFGLIALNLRKRVVDIDWSDTPYRAVKLPSTDAGMPGQQVSSYPDSITKDEVTKDDVRVHAYTLVKAAEYLTQLGDHLRRASYDAVQRALEEEVPGGQRVKQVIYNGPGRSKEDLIRAVLAGAAKAAPVTTSTFT